MEALRISVEEASKILGLSKQTIRCGMQYGKLPIGSVIKHGSTYTYHISPKLLKEYAGDYEDILKEIRK